jgi:hypothetical protein
VLSTIGEEARSPFVMMGMPATASSGGLVGGGTNPAWRTGFPGGALGIDPALAFAGATPRFASTRRTRSRSSAFSCASFALFRSSASSRFNISSWEIAAAGRGKNGKLATQILAIIQNFRRSRFCFGFSPASNKPEIPWFSRD